MSRIKNHPYVLVWVSAKISQDCLELAEAHVDKVETDLAKEKSRNILIVKDLSSLEKVSSYKVVKLQSDVSSSLARAEAAEKKCYENHLLHQVRENNCS